ncbi:MAG TPA: HD domain-containing phosphohydrolase, partial [Candidatus Dormibacteraeota bacterium]|nr:HD domain-containing phosphohydrolase [Candidatus Dormibacteraeota bacterium]
MRGLGRGRFSRELILLMVAGLATVGGASFNVQGYSGRAGVVAIAAALAGFGTGVMHRRRPQAAGLAALALGLHLLKARFLGGGVTYLGINLVGLMALALGGATAEVSYSALSLTIRRRVGDLERVTRLLEEQRRIFIAATDEGALAAADVNEITGHLARVTGAEFCCLYLSAPDGKQFLPQLPGIGFDQSRPPSLSRLRGAADPIFTAIDAHDPVYLDSPEQLSPARRLLPPNFKARNLLVLPIARDQELVGFILLGNRADGFTPDLQRLGVALAAQAGIVLASQSIISQSKEEAERASVLAEITSSAGELDLDGLLDLLLTRAKQVIRHDTAQAIIFGPRGTYTIVGSLLPPGVLAGTPLEGLRNQGEVAIRRMLSLTDPLYSGVTPAGDAAQVAEALVPVSARGQVIGAICLGRRGGLSFGDRDQKVLDELRLASGRAAEVSTDSRPTGSRQEEPRELVPTNPLAEIFATATREQAMDLLLAWSLRIGDASAGCVVMMENRRLRVRSLLGWSRESAAKTALDQGSEICRRALDGGALVIDTLSPAAGAPIKVLCVPLGIRALRVGCVFLANPAEAPQFNSAQAGRVQDLATAAAGMVAAETAIANQEHDLLTAMIGFATALDGRSPYTSGRSERVATYALTIASELGYAVNDPGAARRLHQGCLLHDLGQVVVPDSVWQKSGRLTRAESTQIKLHPSVGFDLLKGIPMLTDELVIIRSHHERFDGRGYPDGKSGDQLPIVVWIAGVADALEAMTGERPHRPSLTIEAAIEELRAG